MTDAVESERCKACNKPFKSHYREDVEMWEDLCNTCLRASETQSYTPYDLEAEIDELLRSL
jgi:ribosomal protein L37AE/L43A